MKIWCLFSIANEYDQPRNNLEAWWSHKPDFEKLASVIKIPFDGEKNILNIVYLHQGQERRIFETDFRLVQVEEGAVDDEKI